MRTYDGASTALELCVRGGIGIVDEEVELDVDMTPLGDRREARASEPTGGFDGRAVGGRWLTSALKKINK